MDPSTLHQPTREILWNLPHVGNVVAMYSLFALSLLIAAVGVIRRLEWWQSGRADEPRLPLPDRVYRLFRDALFQRKVARDSAGGLMHTLIYIGFLTLLFTTTMVMIDHDLGIRIYHGDFYLAVTLLSDVLGFGVLVGCTLAAFRRYHEKTDRLHTYRIDTITLGVLALLIVQGFLLEGLRIHVTQDPWRAYSPIGSAVAGFFWPLTEETSRALHYLFWWLHTATVFLVFALFPYTKFFHVLASTANLYFSGSRRPRGALRSPGDLEQLMESGDDFTIGRATIKDYTWKELLDLDACTSCGRCQAACPAYASGKPLSPKWMILDSRNHALALQAQGVLSPSRLPQSAVAADGSMLSSLYLAGSGLQPKSDGGWEYEHEGSARAANVEVQKAARTIGRSPEDMIAGDVMDPNVFWSCTTCYACVQACPVGIQHVDQIMENRRNMVLMRGEIPHEAQGTLRALENRGNPYGDPQDRIKWLDGLDVPILKEGDRVDYLYWVGCVSAYDPRKQKIARALVQIMQRAGLKFGILGSAEGCSGDPARRLGEENVFQSMAKRNMELLRNISFETLIANCPHCFNTIKHEYPQFGNLGNGRTPEIIHHSVLLKRLIAERRITLKEHHDEFTFHDPCYLGRYNNEYEAPRESLRAVGGLKIIEMERSREQAMCCGAGGGHFWMDLKIGERVNVLRMNQIAETGARNVATACPFCMQMLEDGAKLTEREGSVKVRDIAEVVFEALE